MEKSKGGELARACWKVPKRKAGRGEAKGEWEKKNETVYGEEDLKVRGNRRAKKEKTGKRKNVLRKREETTKRGKERENHEVQIQ